MWEMSQKGYGWFVGEADLRELEGGFWHSTTFESFVTTVQLWAAPENPKNAPDGPDVPRTWAVRVRAGQVSTSNTRAKARTFRTFLKSLPTNNAYAWIAPTVLAKIQ
jgi:hypothetical protein